LPLHVPPGSSYGSAWDEAKLPENRAQMDKTAEDAIRDGLPGYEQEFQCVDKDGRTRWLYEDARIEAQGPGKWSLTGVCIDVTDQRYANERLRKLSSVLDQIADTVVVTDTEGKIEYVNPAFEQATGYTQVEALGRTPAILKSGEHDAAFYEEMWATILRGDSFQAEFVNRTKAGAFFHTEKTITPIRDPSGQVSHFAATGRDVTERYEFERSLEDTNRKLQAALAEIRDTQEQALQQERLRALGQMASGIAHDFNNTLAPILGFADLLLARPATLQDEEKALRYLTTIRTAADDARNIVARMREFYRPRSDGDFLQKLDPQQIVGEAISLTQPRWKDEALARGTPIEVHTELEPVPTLLGDATELREALTNLIFNACDAMPDGGHLTIRTCTGPRDEVVLEVSDTGMGMSEEVRRRCIEPFYTTKETHGTGMGLAMVYGTMGRHAGSVEIESEEGKGSTFRLRFPRREEPTAERASSAAAEIAQPLSVLAVDDEPLVREVIAEYMRGDGHGVHVCTNGVEALDVATSETFDLIITDRAMPEMSGDQLATALREKGVETPIIMLTGFGAVMDDCPEHVDSVVSKPVTLDELRAAISAVV
ncbi:PAS domain S-box protein, partial [Candidatus Poribacteria bacterium]|nr:PAS domain S-box protein [Candidatus Poribacteria bacterium]